MQTLEEARKAVEAGGFLPKYSLRSEKSLDSEKGFGVTIIGNAPANAFGIAPISSHPGTSNDKHELDQLSNQFNANKCFTFLPSQHEQFPAPIARQPEPLNGTEPSDINSRRRSLSTMSLKSSTSSESFKSAISIQEQHLDVARKVKAVQSVMHAFHTALQILRNLIERRILDKDSPVYFAVRDLEESLLEGSKEINHKHINYFKQLGKNYIEYFSDTRKFAKIQGHTCYAVKTHTLQIL